MVLARQRADERLHLFACVGAVGDSDARDPDPAVFDRRGGVCPARHVLCAGAAAAVDQGRIVFAARSAALRARRIDPADDALRAVFRRGGRRRGAPGYAADGRHGLCKRRDRRDDPRTLVARRIVPGAAAAADRARAAQKETSKQFADRACDHDARQNDALPRVDRYRQHADRTDLRTAGRADCRAFGATRTRRSVCYPGRGGRARGCPRGGRAASGVRQLPDRLLSCTGHAADPGRRRDPARHCTSARMEE